MSVIEPLLFEHKPHQKIGFEDKIKFSPKAIDELVNKFKTLKQNEEDNPKIKKYIKKYGIILPFENCRCSLFQILSEKVELKGHCGNIIYLLSIFEQFLELLDQFSEMASKSARERVSFLMIEKKIEDIELTHEKFKVLASNIIDSIKNGTTPLEENGIVQLNSSKIKTRVKKNLLVGLASTSTIFGVAAISVGIVLAPFTGGITLLSTIAGISTIVAGAATTGLGTITAIAGTRYFNQKEIDITKSIQALEMLASQVEVLAASISKNQNIKTQLDEDFEQLIQNELEFLNLFCGICYEILKDPVIIPLPNNNRGQYEIYCRCCITDWNSSASTLPKSRLPFKISDFQEPDFRTKGEVLRFTDLVNQMNLRISKIIDTQKNEKQFGSSSNLTKTNSNTLINK
ncbi:hypothetical protein DDB_G0287879 [Dictyostelium discoideum AX4]|uniref:Transmembrane protein n=1 Tax=Dictyostelium discoideum TaxID=44689 RepID=Q54JX4_DICDI|nr:hypothetical protein DDB_G0287879 [Dictyostelium discoideum AX4]EAL63586.1 hypothetical protein DDB_G0287879 [Dictyostelium discoideum AX4]|eukprot:XP_637028.1 hypothetical protein DDB_G0287879 [Dictyostelium discoideum AX4]